MRFTDIFIKRPVLSLVVNLFILLAGWLAIKGMNIRQYPVTNNAVVSVTTIYPGASAELVRGFITTPLEREIGSADGIDYLESVSAPSMSVVKAKLRLNYDPNAALTQITSKVNKVRGELPADAEDPTFEVAIGESTDSMYLSFSSDILEANQLTDYLIRVVQPKIGAVEGVQKAEVMGARTFAMRIWLKPAKMASLNLSPSQVYQALAAQNFLSAVGKTKGEMTVTNLNARTDLHTAAEFADIIIFQNNNEIVRLSDIADVELGAEDYDAAVKMDGSDASFMAVSVLPTANPIDVIKRVRAIWPEIVEQMPAGITPMIAYDATEFINDSINEVIRTLIEAMIIVIIVIYLFLGSLRSVVIPIVAIPLSLVGCTVLMIAMGFTINLLTLLAMVLAIGLVVDDAIVVVENIHRRIEEGLAPPDAALKGARELVGPIIAMTITLAAVYAPIGIQGGLTGALFREFAFTLASAVLISGFVALTLSPMLSSKFLRHNPNPRGFEALLDRGFQKLRKTYENFLTISLDQRPAMLVIATLIILSIAPFFMLTQSELAPVEDQGFIMAVVGGSPNASPEQAAQQIAQVNTLLKSYPESDKFFSITGFDPMAGVLAPASGFIGWVLKPWKDRPRDTVTMANTFTLDTAKIAGLKIGAFPPPSLPGSTGYPVEFVIASTDDHSRLIEVADEIVKRARASGQFAVVESDLQYDQSQTDIIVDRDKAAAIGVNMQQLGADLGSMLGGGYVNRFSIQGRAYKVTPQVERAFRLNPGQLGDYHISTASGELVPASTIITLESSVQPRFLNRFQQLNAATIQMYPMIPIGEAVAWLDAQAKEIFPQGYTHDYKSESRQFVQEGSTLATTFVLALVVIFLVLAAQYESFRDPLIILMTVPMACAGALVFLFMGFATLNIYTQVGLLTLVGLISKHGILMVEFANKMQDEGMDKFQAIAHAAGVRLRPILMTTAAMVLGVLPLLRATGAGAQSRFSMGLVIATGMSIGTFFTLFILPAIYTFIARDHAKGRAGVEGVRE
ncbi:MAG: efflux RND transporter permease subunit [Opitutaceae bacterium]|jgi:multidrug efflux pump|nr:efflux RND transporter permease subunit [Opitutaceae bacterium]